MSAKDHIAVSSQRERARIDVMQLLMRALQSWQRSRTISALSRLDDRQLKDIGISRSDIPDVVQKLFAQDEESSNPASQPATQKHDTCQRRPEPRPDSRYVWRSLKPARPLGARSTSSVK